MGMACMAGSSDWNMGGGLSAVDSYWGAGRTAAALGG